MNNTTNNQNININISKMEFKGNPIYGGKLSKKYLKFIEKFPNSPIPSSLLDGRNKKKKVLKKKYIKQGIEIINNKLVKEEDFVSKIIFDQVYEPSKFESEEYDISQLSSNDYLLDLMKDAKVKDGEYIKVLFSVRTDDLNEELTIRYDNSEGGIDITKSVGEIVKSAQDQFNGVGNKNLVNFEIKASTNKSDYVNRGQDFILYLNSQFENYIAFFLDNNISCRLVLTRMKGLKEKQIIQNYAEGVEHCILNPILLWCHTKKDDPKTKDKKPYNSIITKIQGKPTKKGYLEIYKYGVPETEINDLVEDLRLKIRIEYPLKKIKVKEWTSTKKPLKVFSYTNTRYNHVEHLTTSNYEDMVNDEMNQDEINIKFNELKNDDVYFIFGKNKHGINWIQTYDKIYKLDSPYNKAVQQFMKETNFKDFKIDANKEYDKTKFIENGTHFNGTTDFMELPDVNDENIKHIDIKKAYSQFHQSKYYNGFCGAVTDLREVDNYDQAGLYYITNLDLSKANKKFVFYNNFMNWYLNKNIYTDAELRFLKDQGGLFKVKYGAYGIRTDFKFNDEMLNTKEEIATINDKYIKISYYAKFIGKCASINYDRKINMFGDQKYFTAMKDESNKIFYNTYCKEATIIYAKQNVPHYKHISAQVTAYQRLNIFEQLLRMDEQKIIRVCVDGIYYFNHECEINNIYQDKTHEKTFNNSPCVDYLSGLFKNKQNSIKGIKFGKKRDFYLNEIVIGAGGNGKSTREFLDYGHTNVLYLAPSWKLARNVEQKIMNQDEDGNYSFNLNPSIRVSVSHRYLNMDFEYKLTHNFNVILHDEASQMTEHTKRKIFNIPNKKNIFLGDLGYQLEPVIDFKELKKLHIKLTAKEKIESGFIDWIKEDGHYEMNLKGFDKVTELYKDYRAKCDKLKEVKKVLRDFIKKAKYAKKEIKEKLNIEAIEYVKKKIQNITINELETKYNPTDMILVSTHENVKKYNKLFSHYKKYLVKNKTKQYSNGEIIYNKPKGVQVAKYKDEDNDVTHAYTIHAIQGETLEIGNKLFIDPSNLFSYRHIYTAVSRARLLEQIFIINN